MLGGCYPRWDDDKEDVPVPVTVCKKHPKYKAIRKPTADCPQCREIWLNKPKAEKV